MVHLLGRGEADTIPCRPAIHLGLRAAAESQQFRPEFLDKVQQAGNRGLLLFVGTAECQTGDMNVQSAGSCRMAEIPHALRFAKDFRPRHFVQMVFQRHRMSDKFKPPSSRLPSVLMYRFSALALAMSSSFARCCLPCRRHRFQLYAEMPQAFAMKHKVGRGNCTRG